MGSVYSVLDVIDSRADKRILKSEHREHIIGTLSQWTIEDIASVHEALKKQPDKQLKKKSLCRWQYLFYVLEKCEMARMKRNLFSQRSHFHPACVSYAMNSRSIIENNTDPSQLKEHEQVETSTKDMKDEVTISAGYSKEFLGATSKLIKQWNVSITSPVFFGHSETTQEAEDLQIEEDFDSSWKSIQIEDKEGDMLGDEEANIRDKHQHKLNKRSRERISEIKPINSHREEIRKKAKIELAAAKKVMSSQEYSHYERDTNMQMDKNEAEWAQEDLARNQKYTQQDEKEELFYVTALEANATKLALFVQEKDTPKGEKMVEQSLQIMIHLKKDMYRLKNEARAKQVELQEAVNASGNKKDKNRSLVLVAESELKKAAAAFDYAAECVLEQEIQLQKAQQLQQRELKFLSIYHVLVRDDLLLGSDAYTVDCRNVVALLLVFCGVKLESKLRYVFELAVSRGKDTLSEMEVLDLMERYVRVLEDVGGCLKESATLLKIPPDEEGFNAAFKDSNDNNIKPKKKKRKPISRCPREYMEHLVKRQFDLSRIDSSKRLMTNFEFCGCFTRIISVSQDLSSVFMHPWKYSRMSQWQLHRMSYVKKYELGLLSMDQLNHRIARLWVTYRHTLNSENKLVIHERALTMGADDPLKPTYGKFMKKRKNKLQSDVVPLEHQGLGNIVYYWTNLTRNAAISIQACWRAKVGRLKAEYEAKRAAFFAAWETALEESTAKVRDEFRKRDEQEAGVARMKWDAAVRMKQVKLKVQRESISRSQVIELMVKEEASVAIEQVNAHFTEMQISRGFKTDEEIEVEIEEQKRLQFLSVIHTQQINKPEPTGSDILKSGKKRERELKTKTRKEFLQRRALLNKGWDPDDPLSYELDAKLEDENDEEELLDLNAINELYLQEENEELAGLLSSRDQSTDEESNSDSEDNQVDDQAVISSNMRLIRTELLPITLPKSTLRYNTRALLMDFGADIDLLYSVGKTEFETEYLIKMQSPHPSREELSRRLRSIGSTMTLRKTEELLQELPSKELLLKFLARFDGCTIERLCDELVNHFGLVKREVPLIAAGMRAILSQDASMGIARKLAGALAGSYQAEVSTVAEEDLKTALDEIKIREKRSAKAALTRIQAATLQTQMKKENSSDSSSSNDDDDEMVENEPKVKKKKQGEAIVIKEQEELSPSEMAEQELSSRVEKLEELQLHAKKALQDLQKAQAELAYASRRVTGYKKRHNENLEQVTQVPVARMNSVSRSSVLNRARKSISTVDEVLGLNSFPPPAAPNVSVSSNGSRIGWKNLKSGTGLHSLGPGSCGNHVAGDWFNGLDRLSLQVGNQDHRTRWLARWKIIEGLNEVTSEAKIEKYSQMHLLFTDFLETAEAFGKVILLERYLPMEQKSIMPVREKAADVGRGDRRYYWQVANIHFKLCIDDDGICNGSDEFAAKYHGHNIRNSIAFSKVKGSRLYVPLEAMIEYNGCRVLASAHAPIEQQVFNAKGDLKKIESDLVLGSVDRGLTIHNTDTSIDKLVGECCESLGLARHGVKGERDLLPKYLHTPADLRGYKDPNTTDVYLMNFRRLFPPESPSETPHIQEASRGHSIFWRQLRPEWVKLQKHQSSDALSMFTLDTPDWMKFNASATSATKKLIKEQIPNYAESLSLRPKEDVMKIDLRQEMHMRGINMRHIGYLRSFFWFQVRGTVQITFKERHIVGSHDITKEVVRGRLIKLRDKKLTLSEDPTDIFDHRTIWVQKKEIDQEYLLDESKAVPLFSSHDEEMFTGIVECDKNSALVRARLLQEMLFRVIKNITRELLRLLCGILVAPSDISTRHVLIHVLNLFIGNSDGSDEFWSLNIVSGIQNRFGICSLGELEKLNLRLEVEDHKLMSAVVRQVLAHFEVEMRDSSISQLDSLCEGKASSSFVFVPSDFVRIGCKVKHNMYLKEYCAGIALSKVVNQAIETSYESVALADEPTAYWPLTERPGARVAANRGSTGLRLCGKFTNCQLGYAGFVKNQWPNRAVHFPMIRDSVNQSVDETELQMKTKWRSNQDLQDDSDEEKTVATLADKVKERKGTKKTKGRGIPAKAHIETPHHPDVVPNSRLTPFSVECWVKLTSGETKERFIFCSGR